MTTECKIVLTTLPAESNPTTIAESLVKSKLAGCVQILPQMTSVYNWEGKIHKDSEYLLLIKTTSQATPVLMEQIRKLHPYDTPEIVVISPTDIDVKYMAWLKGALE